LYHACACRQKRKGEKIMYNESINPFGGRNPIPGVDTTEEKGNETVDTIMPEVDTTQETPMTEVSEAVAEEVTPKEEAVETE
jgi:hypothetical protein